MMTYSELIELTTFEARFDFLKLSGNIGEETFGSKRWLNQKFYTSPEWRKVRESVILRDNGCDLAIADRPIFGRVYVHHIVPITELDLMDPEQLALNPENLITISFDTHNALHYGTSVFPVPSLAVRKPNDTCPWKV